MNTKTLLFLLSALLIIFNGCKPDDPMEPDDHDHDHEEELITTFTYTLTPTDGSAVVLSFKDF